LKLKLIKSITTTIQNKPEADEFLDLFYEKYINLLVKPITDLTDNDLRINKSNISKYYLFIINNNNNNNNNKLYKRNKMKY